MKKIQVWFYAVIILFIATFVEAQTIESIQLANPELNSGKLLMQALKERKSSRAFSEKDLPLNVLSNLLWAANGINRQESGMRTAPSAKNLQEVDIYVAMQKGLYLYEPKEHKLIGVKSEDIREFVGIQQFTQVAPINLIYVTDYEQMDMDLANNQFYSATDTGFVSQNVYLYCASEGLSTVVLGWIDKPNLAKKMNLKESQHIILTQPVGYPAE